MLLIVLYILVVLSLGYMLLLRYYRKAWRSVPVFTASEQKGTAAFISVIVPARNEAENIGPLLHSLMNQSYKAFEVIVVNDHSTDETAHMVASFTQPNIRLLNLADYLDDTTIRAYKKKAIEVAITQAKGELIVTTDADCVVQKNWLTTIAAFYRQHAPAMIVMPVAIDPASTPLSFFQSLDFMMLQGITAGSVHKKLHSMCNGANLAYPKEVFTRVGGFKGIDQIASGDDMLLMEKINKQYPNQIHYLLAAEVIVHTKPAANIRAFLHQRIRWAGKSTAYQEKGILPVLLFVYLYNVWLIAAAIGFGFNGYTLSVGQFAIPGIIVWLIFLGWKLVCEWMLLVPVSGFFNQQRRLIWFPLFQPVHLIYTLIAGTFGMWGRYEWKDRKLTGK